MALSRTASVFLINALDCFLIWISPFPSGPRWRAYVCRWYIYNLPQMISFANHFLHLTVAASCFPTDRYREPFFPYVIINIDLGGADHRQRIKFVLISCQGSICAEKLSPENPCDMRVSGLWVEIALVMRGMRIYSQKLCFWNLFFVWEWILFSLFSCIDTFCQIFR